MKGQTKKGLRLAACIAVAALVIALLPVTALAANNSFNSCPPQNASDIIRMFSQQGSPSSQKNCAPSDILSALQNANSGAACSPSDILNSLGKGNGNSACPPSGTPSAANNSNGSAACSPSDILSALKNGKSVDVNSLYKALCPTSAPACTTKPANPAPTATPKPTAAPKPTATPKPTAAPSTPAPTNPGNSAASELEKQMVELINAERAKAGASPLAIDSKVTGVARAKSQDMIDKNYFSHTSPTYGSPFEMLKAFGVSYRTAGENIAMNRSMTNAHTALMNSAGHRQNILNPAYKSIGVGIVANASGYLYITQMFIG